jgi:hypothetical protein
VNKIVRETEELCCAFPLIFEIKRKKKKLIIFNHVESKLKKEIKIKKIERIKRKKAVF